MEGKGRKGKGSGGWKLSSSQCCFKSIFVKKLLRSLLIKLDEDCLVCFVR
jgi:hypothetical protein